MSLSWINKVKYSPWLYKTWNFLGSLAVNTLKVFVRPRKNLVVFVSYGGKKYDDSPRCIYEQMLVDDRFADYDLVWAFLQPEIHDVGRGRKIKIDSFEYYKTLLQASCWVTNSTVERGLNFKGKKSFYLNTFHGVPIKKMGSDISVDNKSFKSKSKGHYAPYDIFVANGRFDADIFTRVFRLNPSCVVSMGYPRNDELVDKNNSESISELKKKLNIPEGKIVMLYAPTYREFSKDADNNCTIAPPIDWKRWVMELGNDYVMLFRAHYEVVKVMNVEESDFLRNVSNYPSLNELMLVSDMLISDYSSIFFDYSILGRPMLTFCYDFEEYSSKRGMYFDIRKELGNDNPTEDKLLEAIRHQDVAKAKEATIRFRLKYMEIYGGASKKCADLIFVHTK